MDQNGFDFKALRMNTAPTAPSNPPFSMLQQRPTNLRKPFAFIQTQSRNSTENHSASSAPQIPQNPGSTRRHVEPLRMKQEPNDHHAFPNARHPQSQQSLIPQPRNELMKTQSHKLRAFTTATPTYDEHHDSSQPPFDAPQYFSSPKAPFKNAHSNVNRSQEPTHSPSVLYSRSPSLQVDQDFDVEDADLSQLMTKRMREAKMIKSKLAEQRLATATLESRLSAQTAASEASELALKNRISELEAREASRLAKANEELRAAKSQIEDTERKLQDATTRLNDIQAVTKTGLDEVRSKLSTLSHHVSWSLPSFRSYAALQAHLKDLKSDYDASQDAVKRLSEELAELRQTAMDSVKGMSFHVAGLSINILLEGIEVSEHLSRASETRALIEELQSDRASAHQVIDMLRDKLHLLSAQLVEARERVTELEAIRERKIERVETKVEELADKLVKKEEEGARALADVVQLEARLHETAERLLKVSTTLEEKEVELKALSEQKIAWEWELKEKSARITSLLGLSADIVVHKELNVTLECQVKELKEQNIVLECQAREDRLKISSLQVSENELVHLRAEKVALECELKETRGKLAALEDLQKEQVDPHNFTVLLYIDRLASTSAKLRQFKDQAQQFREQRHQQETQLVQVRAELKSAENLKEQLRASLEAAQLSEGKLSQEVHGLRPEVHALTLREAVLQERETVLQEKSSELAAQLTKVTTEASAREEELRRVNTKITVLQERFDSQALTLKLAKEQSGDLQERLLLSESSHATKLESAIGKLNVELAVLREQKTGLQASLNQAKEEAVAQQAGFLNASVDYESKLVKQEETHTKLIQAEERRAVSAERDFAEAKRLVDDLMQQVEAGRVELEDVKSKSREAASRVSMGVEGEVVVLRARLEELEGENSRLQHRARILNQRYKDNDLSDSEKSFVNSLMQLSQSIHEQDIVAKENELRRARLPPFRENMITSLQTRIDTLESTLARLLKERGTQGGPSSKSMVDLSLWMSSSPRSAEKKATADAQQGAAASTSARAQPLPSPTVFVPDTPPVKKSSKGTKPAAVKSSPARHAHKSLAAIDAEDDPLTESEDDTPRSVTLGKRSRTPTSGTIDGHSRPARRLRATASRKIDPESRKVEESSKKVADGAKSKQRKRR
ncbi:hypothetical protein C8F04DRAFT_1388497 [Mycena alexandri]|uniref:Uncharacterized protein n=1 Tax=Mycena alexandri TaxID=1745969 RepID=A0AAD6TIJ9_9AGAR|nr:hypothetical protein C8F04DRAFT_1388497 [Mycena alexandri]